METQGSVTTLKPPSVYVKDTGTPKGRGVFAARRFGVGDVIEECPVMLLKKPYETLHKELKTIQALALGYGSLYNHSNPSNLRYETDGEALLLRLVAVRGIEPDEELTINYNADAGAPVSDEDWWFEEKGIKLV
jgi:SET domain-containing protein